MNPPNELIGSVVGEILETMYFCDPVYLGSGTIAGPLTGATLDFSGPFEGRFQIVVATSAAAQMAADFLAGDRCEMTYDQVDGTIRELANVACGATLGSWMPAGEFHFAIPVTAAAPPDATYAHCFSLNGQEAEFAIGFELIQRG